MRDNHPDLQSERIPIAQARDARAAHARRRRGSTAIVVLVILLTSLVLVGSNSPATAGVVTSTDIAPVWAVHETGHPVLVTAGDYQYVAFYDEDLYLSVAQRPLSGSTWTIHRFDDAQSNWETGAHHAITMEVDSLGRVHVAGRMHAEPLKYYRMTTAHDMGSFVNFSSMVGTSENRVTYPLFLKAADGRLFFTYRDGGSGDGSQIINTFSATTGSWTRTIPSWFSGQGEGAYIRGPELGPDGYFHMMWMWRRDVPLNTTHDVHYARSTDLVNWKTATGATVALPITPTATNTLFDDVPENGGLHNAQFEIGFDSADRAVLTYIKYDPTGDTQIYNARHESSGWRIVAASDWDYRWDGGRYGVDVKSVERGTQPGTLQSNYVHAAFGTGANVLDEATLQPLSTLRETEVGQRWPKQLNDLDTPSPPRPMEVHWIEDTGTATAGREFVLRWEHGPLNGDAPLPQPWPSPTMLRVVELNDDLENHTSDNIALGATVTASSEHTASGWSKQNITDGLLYQSVASPGHASSSSLSTNHTEWVSIDLGQPEEVTQVSLLPTRADGRGLPIDFALQVSNDGTTWESAVERTGVVAEPGQQTYSFTPRSARYVRLYATRLDNLGGDFRLQLAEMLVNKSAPETTAPGAPTAVSASAENGAAAVSWNAPANSGGSPVTLYVARATPGGKKCQVTDGSTACRISGLTNGTSYNVSVTATNTTGTSIPSPSSTVTPVAPPAPAGVVSNGKSVTVSSEHTASGWGRQNATDGVLTQTVASPGHASSSTLGSNHTEWITVDLGRLYTVGEVDLYPVRTDGRGLPIDYKIQISKDNATWTTKHDAVDVVATPGPRVQSFTPSSARYVKLTATQIDSLGGDYRLQLAEMQIKATEPDAISLGAPTFASSEHTASGWSRANATDGELAQTTSSPGFASSSSLAVNHVEWLTIDLGAASTFDEVVMYPTRSDGRGLPIDYTIQVSQDNTNWTSKVTKNAIAAGPGRRAHTFSATSARYVRLYATKLDSLGGDYRLQLAELLILGS